ncbi:MAG: hypothetical protein JRN20_18130 [Nitrososphaerota archaeon]|nr:hypothetical protein [Nitrososphaerota archaeon]
MPQPEPPGLHAYPRNKRGEMERISDAKSSIKDLPVKKPNLMSEHLHDGDY